MFGQNKTPFGTSTGGFGFGATTSNASPFGHTFGQNKTAATGFGNNTSAFGAPANSMFGTNTTGGTGMFGTNTGGFGQQPTTNTFGGGFGTNATTAAPPLFGQPANTAGASMFGTSTSTFNQAKPTFGFGGGTTLFGQQQQQPAPQQPTSLFGQTNTGQGLFGASPFGQTASSGTTIKFNPLTGNDTMMKQGVSQNINTRHQCITCMKEYENKSLEELRLEDYAANRKGSQQPGGLFSTTTQQSSLFGNPPNNANTLFGQNQNKSVFSTSSGFGGGSFFGGNTQQQPTSLFSKPAAPFGQSTTTNSVSFNLANTSNANTLFGQNQNKPFGSVAPQPTTNLFGNPATTQATGSFGTNTSGTGFGFGFGGQQQQNQGMFGTQNKSLFGTPTTSTGLTFGQPANNALSGGGLFGAKPPGTFGAGFGATSTAGNAFGSTFNTGTNLFGQQNKPATTGFGLPGTGTGLNLGAPSLFGTNTSKPSLFGTNTGFGANTFGTNTLGGTGLGGSSFGNMGTNFGFGSNLNPTMNQPMSNQQDLSLAAQQQILALASNPFGDSPLFRNVSVTGKREEILKPTNPAAQKALIQPNKYKVSPHVNARIKVRAVKSPTNGIKAEIFSDFEDDNNPSPFVPRSSLKKLVLKPKSNNASLNVSSTPTTPVPHKEADSSFLDTPNRLTAFKGKAFSARTNSANNDSSLFLQPGETLSNGDVTQNASNNEEEENLNPKRVILTNTEYLTDPTVEALNDQLSTEGAIKVRGFVITRKNYGSVYFPGEVELTGLNLDETVQIKHKEVIIYTDDNAKPGLGKGLNCPAEVTLYRVWPRDKSDPSSPVTSQSRLQEMKYEEKLRNVCERIGAHYVSYESDCGTWVFNVDHWSKYGITDADEEDAVPDMKKQKLDEKKTDQSKQQSKPVFEPPSDVATVPTSTVSLAMPQQPARIATSAVNDFLLHQDQQMEDDILKSSDSELDDEQVVSTSIYVPDNESSRRVQLMKMSLFNEDSVTQDHIGVADRRPKLLKDNLFSAFQEKTVPVVTKRLQQPPPLVIQPRTVTMQYSKDSLMLNDSLLSYNVATARDEALRRKCSFRVGWGPGLMLAHLQAPQKRNSGDVAKDNSTVVMASVSAFCGFEKVHAPVVESLQVQLRHTKGTSETCPRFVPEEGTMLIHAHADVLRKDAGKGNENDLTIWELCEALWGDLSDSLKSNTPHIHEMSRKTLLSKWLKTVSTEYVEKDLASANSVFTTLLAHMSGYCLVEASKYAIANRSFQLATLLSQVNTVSVQRYVHQQLENWAEVGADKFVSPEYLELMLYVAGVPVWTGSDTKATINTCRFLEWKRSFGLHLWYFCPLACSIADITNEYEDAYKGQKSWGIYSPAPIPRYIEDQIEEVDVEYSGPLDMCYHFIKLYSQHGYRLEPILTPSTYTLNHMDYSLAWFLQQSLASVGYRHVTPYHAAIVTTSFAAQLEEQGLWHWSIFVLLHLQDATAREHAIHDVLGRRVLFQSDESYLQIEKITNIEFCIPQEWIYEAKALRANLEKDYHSEAWFWLLAGKLDNCHKTLMSHIVNDAVINEDYDSLIRILEQLNQYNSSSIEKWHGHGGLILSYIQLQEQVNTYIMTESITTEDINSMVPLLNNVSFGLDMLPTARPKDRLCQAEIAKRLAYLFRIVFSFYKETSPDHVLSIQQQLAKFPMPEDYAVQELKNVYNVVINST